jgi:hypothetical protein
VDARPYLRWNAQRHGATVDYEASVGRSATQAGGMIGLPWWLVVPIGLLAALGVFLIWFVLMWIWSARS